VPMILGAVMGGGLYRLSASLPFLIVAAIAVGLLALLLVRGKTRVDQRSGERAQSVSYRRDAA